MFRSVMKQRILPQVGGTLIGRARADQFLKNDRRFFGGPERTDNR